MKIKTVVPLATTTRPRYKMERTGTPEYATMTRVVVGHEEVTYRADLNLDELDGMAKRAAANRSGKCKDGALVVVVVNRRAI
jgi:hypothetical protein